MQMTEYKPLIVAFCCNWCSYAGADLAGNNRLNYPAEVKIIRVPCSCRVNPSFILRAFQRGADGVIICNRQTDVLNPNVIRASTGAIYYVPVAETSSEECVEWLRKHNITSIAASPHSTDVYTDYDMTKGIAIVVGAEQYGLTDYWMNSADVNVQIPMLGKMDSLNVATAATILLYEAARQRGFKKG